MPLAFLAPMALAAGALVFVPWYLHHIRRPERQPTMFSSLMFVPDVRKEVIERRRLQHLLLMLLRMLVVLLLALAFARPFIPVQAIVPPSAPANHVLVLDVSYSMGAGDAFTAAKGAAHRILDGLEADSKAAAILAGARPRLAAPLASPELAKRAIDAAELTLETTNYEAALRMAVDVFHDQREADSDIPLVIHLISDFQQAGMPAADSTFRLPAHVTFEPVAVARPQNALGISDVHAAMAGNKRIEVRAKVKNWSQLEGTTADVRLVIDGQTYETKSVDVAPGNASLVTFSLDAQASGALYGWVELDDALLTADNRRYFVWNAPARQRVLLVQDSESQSRWTAADMLRMAVSDSLDAPWQGFSAPMIDHELAAAADVVIVTDAARLDGPSTAFLIEHLVQGGSALIVLGGPPANENLLSALGLASRDTARRDAARGGFVTLSWIDFEHPTFHAFASPLFNDFSAIRFFDHHVLDLQPDLLPARAIATFEAPPGPDADPPAIIDVSPGAGRALVWAFSLDADATNLAKTARFVPLVHESLAELAGGPDETRSWLIGDTPDPPRPAYSTAIMTSPEGSSQPVGREPVGEAGFLVWRAGDSAAPERVEAVNVDAREGNPAFITPAEFALRISSASVAAAMFDDAGSRREDIADAAAGSWEYGRYILGLVLAALLLEIWYAGKLS
jgi:hypothetical protein